MAKTRQPAKRNIKKNTKKQSSKKQVSIFGRKLTKLHIGSLAAVLVFASIGAYFTFFSQAATGGFVKVATHPQANLQPDYAKYISSMQGWNGKLYTGYGNWTLNTGPITINPFDGTNFASTLPREQLPACGQGVATPEACNADTEAIERWRILKVNGVEKLYAPSIDPRCCSDYAVGTRNTDGTVTWQNLDPVNSAHVFDMTTLTGTDLWMVGSQGADAMAWRSLDGGATWEESLRIGGSTSSFRRIYNVGVQGGKLYVHPTGDSSYEPNGFSKVFDPATNSWSNGPKFGHFHKPDSFAGKMIYQYQGLTAFDGSSLTSVYPTVVNSYVIERDSVNGDTIYLLSAGQIVKSKDLANWTVIYSGSVPEGVGHMAVVNNDIYLGGTQSAIYKYDANYTPPPTSGGGGSTNDTVAPTVSISQPADGTTLGNRTTIQASATDNVKVTKMEIYDGPTLLKTSTTGTIKYGWNTRNISLGEHTITVKAHDAAGKVGEASVTVSK